MYKRRKKSAIVCAGIFVALGLWMSMFMSTRSHAAGTNTNPVAPSAFGQTALAQEEAPAAETETAEQKLIRVASFEDTFNYVDAYGVRRGFGYELLQALSGYTGWTFEYVKCDWSNCFEKLENVEIDILGDISYSDERAEKMLYSAEPMGDEKYILYADLSQSDSSVSDFSWLDGKRVGVLLGTEPEVMLSAWEAKNGIQTEHVNAANNDDVKRKLANHEIDGFVSLEESIWSERGISSVTCIGSSGIYYVINQARTDIKTELDRAMRQLEQDSPFYRADLYKKYFTLDYSQSLTGEESAWLTEHGNIRIGFLDNDPSIFSMDEESGKLSGALPDYISYAVDCLGNPTLSFDIKAYKSGIELIQALQNRDIDMVFYVSRNPDFAEKSAFSLSNTAWNISLMAVTDDEAFDEKEAYTVAVPEGKEALRQHLVFSYPQWTLVFYDSLADATDMLTKGSADCFIMASSKALKYDNARNFQCVPLTKNMEACFAVRGGESALLSILNKTLKTMPSDMLTSALAIYDSTPDKVTFTDFIKDNLLAFSLGVGFLVLCIITIILLLLRKAMDAEAVAKRAAKDTRKLNEQLEIALKNAEEASLAKTRFLNSMSHDIRTPMNVILGYAQLMEEELKEQNLPETTDHLEKLQESGNLLLSIINNVLDMARIESGRMEVDESYAQMEDILKSLYVVFDADAKKKKIALNFSMNVEHTHVSADVTKVKEIFVNILSNALKYTPSGGTVTVSVDEIPCAEAGYMMVKSCISDTGIGMSSEYLSHIFEAFTREQNGTKSKIQSTGLGMSIVKKYVDLLGGTIEVESTLGKGSTFTVTLKHKIADDRSYDTQQLETPEASTESLKGRKLLLAEDNDLNAEIAVAILERAGLSIERVEDGIQCVDQIANMPAGSYDAILMDIQMPRMDGYKATREIRHMSDPEKAGIPIIAMTANAFEEDKKAAIAAGMNAHIAKPIDIKNVLTVLEQVLG